MLGHDESFGEIALQLEDVVLEHISLKARMDVRLLSDIHSLCGEKRLGD
jgi:hypothetical protein